VCDVVDTGLTFTLSLHRLRSFIVGSFLVDLRAVYLCREGGGVGRTTETFVCACVGNIGAPMNLPAAFDEGDSATPCRPLDPLATGLISRSQPGECLHDDIAEILYDN
jgi:hypothetical protein